MKIAIIEDEKLSAEHLVTLLKKVDPAIRVTAVFDSVKRCEEAFRRGVDADLLLVDIHLADGLSFDIFSRVQVDTPVIFTTAYDNYAIQAFKLNSIDYLLKPIGLEDLGTAIDKYKRLHGRQGAVTFNQVADLYRQLAGGGKSRFMVKSGDALLSVKTSEVHHFVAEDGICLLVNTSGKRYPVDYTLDQLEPLLPAGEFFRMNRKILLSLAAVDRVSSYFNSRLKVGCAWLEGDNAVVSRERVADFKRWLDQ